MDLAQIGEVLPAEFGLCHTLVKSLYLCDATPEEMEIRTVLAYAQEIAPRNPVGILYRHNKQTTAQVEVAAYKPERRNWDM